MRELPGHAVGEARMAAAKPIAAASHRRGFIVATVAAVAMTLTGAFGTFSMPPLTRALYWLIIMEAGALIGIAATIGIRSWGRLGQRPWIEGAIVSLLIALPLTLVVLLTSLGFFGRITFKIGDVAFMFAMVFIVTAMITAINYATARAAPVIVEAEPAAPAYDRPRLTDRLPPHLRAAAIHALEAEDHYLRIHTAAGSDLILMRMGDAIQELDGLDGARTHRSWWVARDAIRSVARKDGRAELTLADGIVAPVSRSAYPELRDKGWFA